MTAITHVFNVLRQYVSQAPRYGISQRNARLCARTLQPVRFEKKYEVAQTLVRAVVAPGCFGI
jgi:hypothetical protein